MESVEYIDDQSFDETVIQSGRPVLVDFTASWCRPCKMLSPILEELTVARNDIKIVKIDVGGDATTREPTNPQTKNTYDIEAFPTLYLFRGGKIVDGFQGVGSKDELTQWIDTALAKPVANDMSPQQAKQHLEVVTAQRQNEQAEKGLMRAQKISQNAQMVSGAFKVAGGLSLFTISSNIITMGLGLATVGIAVHNIHGALTSNPWKNQGKPSAVKKGLSITFNAVTAAAGAALVMVPTAGIQTAAAFMIGGWMALSGGLGLALNLYGLSRQFKSLSQKNHAEEPAPEPECVDGVCKMPDRNTKEDHKPKP